MKPNQSTKLHITNNITTTNYVIRFTAEEIFVKNKACVGYSYDDLILMPGYINFGLNDVNISTNFSKNIKLEVPFVSSPMDTVTESKMAIRMALMGGYVHLM